MLASFTPASISSTINASEYLDLVVKFCLTFGIIAELPVLSALLSLSGILKSSLMVKQRKYVTVGIWIFAAVMTPPDVLSQTLVAIPLMLLYEVSILICWLIEKIRG
jgi:sec-independent protein translocase protein TatC